MASLKDRCIVITGASRGIGAAIAQRCAQEGANLVLASKSMDPHPKLAGTLTEVAEAVEAAGGQALALQVDVRYEESVDEMVAKAIERFGRIDCLVNNAGAISLTDLSSTPMKKVDLMFGINVRATYMCASKCLPYLEQSDHAKILSLSPPIDLAPRWIANNVAYTISKYGMTLCTLGLGEELRERNIAVTSLWPRTLIGTAAVNMLLGEQGMQASRTPEIMADAAYEILSAPGLEYSGQALIDEHVLRARGVTDFDKYNSTPGVEPMLDYYVSV